MIKSYFYLKKILLVLFLFNILSCARSNQNTDPNAYYYFGFGKYLLSVNDYDLSWSGLFIFPSSNSVSLNYQNTFDFSCRGLATYELSTPNSPFFPTNIGDVYTINGTLQEPQNSCFNNVINLQIKYMGKDPTNQDYYELTLNAERYLIKTFK